MSEELMLHDPNPSTPHGIIARLKEWNSRLAERWTHHHTTRRLIGVMVVGAVVTGCSGNVSADKGGEALTPEVVATQSVETKGATQTPEAEVDTNNRYTQEFFEQALANSNIPSDTPETAHQAYENFVELQSTLQELNAMDDQTLIQETLRLYDAYQASASLNPNIGLPSNYTELYNDIVGDQVDTSISPSVYEQTLVEMLAPNGISVWIPRSGEATNKDNLEPLNPESPEEIWYYKNTILQLITAYSNMPMELARALPHTVVVGDVVVQSSNGLGEAPAYVTRNGDTYYVVFDGGGNYDVPLLVNHEWGHLFAIKYGDDSFDAAFNALYPTNELPSLPIAQKLYELQAQQVDTDGQLFASYTTQDGETISTVESANLIHGELPDNLTIVGSSIHNLHGNEGPAGVFELLDGRRMQITYSLPPEYLDTILAQQALSMARIGGSISKETAATIADLQRLQMARGTVEKRMLDGGASEPTEQAFSDLLIATEPTRPA